jgi:hypothetical protein
MSMVFVGALMIVDSQAPSTTSASAGGPPRFAGAERSYSAACFAVLA